MSLWGTGIPRRYCGFSSRPLQVTWIFWFSSAYKSYVYTILWSIKWATTLCLKEVLIKTYLGTCLVAQWLRIRLPMQRTQVRALVQEDPTCRGAIKPMCHNYWACTLEPASHNCWARVLQLLKPAPRAHAPQQEKPLQWEARALQQRVAPAHRSQRKPAHSNEDPTQPKKKKTQRKKTKKTLIAKKC